MSKHSYPFLFYKIIINSKNMIDGKYSNTKAIILARVSSKEQEDNQSIPAQTKNLTEYASRVGFLKDKIEIIQIVESSTKDERRKFQLILEKISKTKEEISLIIDTIDRLQRSFKESVVLDGYRKQGKLEIHFVREGLIINKDSNSSEILRWDMGVMFAKSYVLQLSDNVKRSIKQNLQEGKIIGKAPIGYLNAKDENGNKIVKVDEGRAIVIKKLFELYSTGNYSLDGLFKEADKMGFKQQNSNETISKQYIHKILNNPFYYGQYKIKEVLYSHTYEPIISYRLFEKCQEIMHRYHIVPYLQKSKPFIFRGLIKCAECGCLMSPEIKKGKFIYYACTNWKKNCKRDYINEDVILKQVYSIFDTFKFSEERIEKVKDGIKEVAESKNIFNRKFVQKLNKEYSDIQNKSNSLLDLLIDKSITKDVYDKKLKEFKSRQQGITDEIDEHTRADESFNITASIVLDVSQRIKEIFEKGETEEKRKLINMLIQNCEIKQKKLLVSLRTPFDTIAIYANSNSWLNVVCKIITFFKNREGYFYIPKIS